MCSVKNMFIIKLSQNLQENTCVRVRNSKKIRHVCFPVNFVKVLRATFFYRTHPAVASEKLVSCKPNLIWQLLWHIQREEIWQFPLLKHTAMLLSISYYQYFADLSMTWKSSKRAYDGVKISTIVDFHLLL